ncbi:unnamed protein product [Vitrella brassicaformis CCMP3155]|uniref:Uncharacterized protein n=1 Tax=Vitrella brassicaformis (strain CCMP3155) TaxID=1169540 RepID=A0A0G4FVV0_VITBC|nr:unnamed protein product [Vitrella brassicaformis CCMP3155]|eukprot:CEM18728.1 unnamed protein product [Vitrella brassicaformis CCMP3155]
MMAQPKGQVGRVTSSPAGAQATLSDAMDEISTIAEAHTLADSGGVLARRGDEESIDMYGEQDGYQTHGKSIAVRPDTQTNRDRRFTMGGWMDDYDLACHVQLPLEDVALSPSAAAAAAGAAGGPDTVTEPRQQGGPNRATDKSSYGRPCLPGLPEVVINLTAALIETSHTARLSRVNLELYGKITHETMGVYRNLIVTSEDEEVCTRRGRMTPLASALSSWTCTTRRVTLTISPPIRRSSSSDWWSKMQTVHLVIATPFIFECLEASRPTLKAIMLGDVHVRHSREPRAASASPVVFPQVEELRITNFDTLCTVVESSWQFSRLKSFDTGSVWAVRELSKLNYIIEHAPALRHIDAAVEAKASAQWRRFVSLCAQCPNLTSIGDLETCQWEFDALHDEITFWRRPDRLGVMKHLSICDRHGEISATSGQRLPIGGRYRLTLPDLLEWARSVKCNIDWSKPSKSRCFTVRCSQDVTIARPATLGRVAMPSRRSRAG